jgi:hypothetical protein
MPLTVSENEAITTLSDLAAAYRSSPQDRRPAIIREYNAVLDALLELGWTEGLDPYDELPDQHLCKRYLEVTRSDLVFTNRQLLRESVNTHDPLMMSVKYLGNQAYVGEVRHVYARRFQGPQPYESGPLFFVGSAGAWGNQTLVDGELALVFITYLKGSSKYYQEYWRGHLSIENFNDVPYAVANRNLTDGKNGAWGPEYLRCEAFSLGTPGRTALPLTLVERHIAEEIAYFASPKLTP